MKAICLACGHIATSTDRLAAHLRFHRALRLARRRRVHPAVPWAFAAFLAWRLTR